MYQYFMPLFFPRPTLVFINSGHKPIEISKACPKVCSLKKNQNAPRPSFSEVIPGTFSLLLLGVRSCRLHLIFRRQLRYSVSNETNFVLSWYNNK